MTQDVAAMLAAEIDPADLRGLFPGDLADKLRLAISNVLAKLDLSSLTPEQKRAILDTAKSFFDTVVRPFDIPYIPQLVENMVDDWIWMAVESFLRKKLAI